MQPERQIAAFCVILGGAFIAPEVAPLLKQPETVPSGLFIAGGVIGALGVFFGTLLSLDAEPRGWRWLSCSFWGILSFVDCGCMQLGALRTTTGSVRFYACEIAAVLALAAFVGVLHMVSRTNRPKKPTA